MPIGTDQDTLHFKSVNSNGLTATFIGASANTVIDTFTHRLGIGVDSNGPTSNLHVVGNAYISTDLTVVGDIDFSGTFNQNGAPFSSSPWTKTGADLSYTTGNVSLGKELTVTGNVSVSDDLTVTGGVTSTTSLMSNVVTIGTTKTFVVKVGSNGKYEINGVDRPTLHLHQHQTYIFDLSDSSLIAPSVHPFRISETATGDAYDTGITTTGAYGSTEKRTFVVPAGAPTTLYYYCTSHSGMGATASISSTAELMVSGRVESTDLVVTGTGGSTLGSGTTAQRPANPTLGTIRYNSTTGFMEAYAAVGWAPIAQPPTVTGISPLTTLTSGGVVPNWSQQPKIQSTDIVHGDYFGGLGQVSMSSDGTKAIVGAYGEDPPTSAGGTNAGSAYIFTYNSSTSLWSQQQKLVASDAASPDYFGSAVSMNSDGTKVIVGARGQDVSGGSNDGAAYIFTYNSSTSLWSEETMLVATDSAQNLRFGEVVSMSGDGTKVIVGTGTGSVSGAAYIFTYSSGSWDAGTKIQSTGIDATDYFGISVSINSDGTKVIVGAKTENTGNDGAAYIFVYSDGSWDAGTKLVSPTANPAGDYFGASVDISGDGNLVIVGSQLDSEAVSSGGAAYIYTYSGGSWDTGTRVQASVTELDDNFGYSVSMSSDGTKVIVGALLQADSNSAAGTGAAYIFVYNSGTSQWSQQQKLLASDATNGDKFGISVHMSRDGTKVIVGASPPYSLGRTGGAYIFDFSAEVLDSSTQVFTATGTGIVSGSTVQLEGADGSLYSVFDATAAGTQVTFKMGTLGASGGYAVAQQPYKLKVNSTSGLIGTSTAVIGFAVGWTTAADADLTFITIDTTTQTLVGTDGGGGTNRTFSLAPGSNALPSGLQPVTAGGAITGQIAALGTTSVTFRLTDNATGLFTDRAINIVGSSDLYTFSPNPFKFTNGGQTGYLGPELVTLTGHADYSAAAWRTNPAHFNLGKGYYPDSGSDASTPQRGFQLWTVPKDGTYTIQAQGALGGDANFTSQTPGKGARVQADFTLTKGTKIIIIVGQGGVAATNYQLSSGGGGGTFVLKNNFGITTDDIYLIAGGGTGTSEYTNSNTYLSANGSSQGTSHVPYNNQGPNGGSGGGGWGQNGKGGDGVYTYGKSVHNFVDTPQTNSRSYSVLVKPGQGGVRNQSSCGDGGFGGGGSGQHQTSGGGGGYGAGGAGYYNSPSYAPAATSWIMPNGTTSITVTNRTFLGNPGGTATADFNGWVLITQN